MPEADELASKLSAERGKLPARVCLSPALLGTFDVQQHIVVVIDILRASTTICVALDNGITAIKPVESPAAAKHLQETERYLAAAERNGSTYPGFSLGNSPYMYMDPKLQGQRLALTTTNGTRALHAASKAEQIVIGAFVNQSVLVHYLKQQGLPVMLLCSGWKDNINLEDSAFAGAMIEALAPEFFPADDAALMALALYQGANERKRYYFEHSSHHQRLVALGLQKDVKYCLQGDIHPVLPVYDGTHLVNVLSTPAN